MYINTCLYEKGRDLGSVVIERGSVGHAEVRLLHVQLSCRHVRVLRVTRPKITTGWKSEPTKTAQLNTGNQQNSLPGRSNRPKIENDSRAQMPYE